MEGSCGLLGGKGKGEEETVLYKEILWTMEKEKIEEVKVFRITKVINKDHANVISGVNISKYCNYLEF